MTGISDHLHFDVTGSYLRPQYLKDARSEFEAGKISQEELRKIEDKAIIELIEKQIASGLKIITDGEFRRSWWHLDFFWGFNNVEKILKPGIIVKAEDEVVHVSSKSMTVRGSHSSALFQKNQKPSKPIKRVRTNL